MDAEEKLTEIEDLNVKIRSARRYRHLVKEAEKCKEESDKLTQQINRLEQDKSTRIANAQFPIPGLAINDDCVLYNNIPFTQLSTGEQIRISTAIAMAMNPEAKIILCREGSLLDKTGIEEIENIAKDNDYQLWIETVDDSGKVGIYIEDGQIKSIDGKEISQ